MFQPVLRMRDEDWGALSADELDALDAGSRLLGPDEPWPARPPEPVEPCDVAWEDLERSIPNLRKAEARQLRALLSAWRAVDDDLIDHFGTDFAEHDRGVETAFRSEAALALDMGDQEVTVLLGHLDLAERRLPRTWAALADGRLNRRALQTIVREIDGLDLDRYSDAYDEAAVLAVDSVRGTRLRQRMHQVRETLQASTAEERHTRAEARHGTAVDVQADGVAAWVITASAEQVRAAEDAIERAALAAADRPRETRSIGQLKAALALGHVLRGVADPSPGSGLPRIVPTVTLTIPALTLLGRDDAPAILDGHGPIDPVTARQLAGEAKSFTRVLTHPVTGVPLTMEHPKYRIPKPLRRWLRHRDGTCRYPGCPRPAAKSQIDHRQEWHDDGRTAEANLAHLCPRHHRLKSLGIFHITSDPDTGVHTWRFPSGRTWTSPPAPPGAPAPRWLREVLEQHPD